MGQTWISKIHGALFLCLLIVSSCGKSLNVDEQDIDRRDSEIRVVDGGVKTFTLDDEANFENLNGLKLTEIDGQEYLAFYGREAHAIYMYNYQAGDLFRKIIMKKNGPNAIKGSGGQFFFHSMDSIFINSGFGIRLINSRAEVLTKRTAGSKQKNGVMVIDSNVPILRFDQSSRFGNGQIEMLGLFFNRTKEDYERAIFDFGLNQVTEEFIKTETLISNFDEVLRVQKERRKRGEFAFKIPRQFASNKKYLYGTTPISDSLYLFEEGELLKVIYAGVPNVEVAPYSAYASLVVQDHIKDGFNYFDNPKQPPYFKNMLMSPDGRFIYRVFYHGAKPRFVENSERAIPFVFEATLIVVDLETDDLIYYDLPVDEIELEIRSNRNLFVSNNGIHFRVKDQENEEEVHFRLFSITQ